MPGQPLDMETAERIFVQYKDLNDILESQSDRTVEKLQAQLNPIKRSVARIDKRCKTRGAVCPGINLEKKMEQDRKILEFEQDLQLNKVKFFGEKWKLYVTIGAGLIIATLGAIMGVVVYASGLLK